MKNVNHLKIILALVFLTTTCFSQTSNSNQIYGVNYDVLKLLSKKKKITNAFHTTTHTLVKKTSTRIKIINTEYAPIQKQILAIEQEKEIFFKNYNAKIKKYDDINQITLNIQDFLKSNKPFESKKSLLKSSQLLANQYHIKGLIYADKTINKSNKSKFFVYSLNAIDLKLHLRKLIPSIKSQNIEQPAKETFDETVLNQLKSDFEKMKPFYYLEKAGKDITTNRMMIDGEIKDISHLSGKFEKLHDCFVILSDYKDILKKNQVISLDKIQEMDIQSNIKTLQLILIKNLNNNTNYVVNSTFLNEFGYKFN